MPHIQIGTVTARKECGSAIDRTTLKSIAVQDDSPFSCNARRATIIIGSVYILIPIIV